MDLKSFPSVEHTIINYPRSREDREAINKLMADWCSGKKLDGIPVATIFQHRPKPVALIVNGWEKNAGTLGQVEQIAAGAGFAMTLQGVRHPEQAATKSTPKAKKSADKPSASNAE